MVIYQHGDIFTLPRNEDVTRGAESRQIPKPTVRLTRFTEKERITVLEHAVVRSEVKAVVRVFRTCRVRVPRIKFFDFILVFQDFAYYHIAIDDMLDGRTLYKMERSVWKFFSLTEHSIEQKDIAYVYALPIQMLCRDFVLTKSRLPPGVLILQYTVNIRVKVTERMLLKIKSRVNLLDNLLISTPLIDQIS